MKIKLLGELGDKFGHEWNAQVRTVSKALRLINCQRKNFIPFLLKCEEEGMGFTVQRGEEYLDEKRLALSLGEEDLIMSLVPAGTKGGGGKIILGIILIVAVVASGGAASGAVGGAGNLFAAGGTYTSLGTFTLALGTNLALMGLNELLAPGPEVDKETPDSYLFQGANNNIIEGTPVPLLYGEMIVGGAPISVSFTTQAAPVFGYMFTPIGDGSFVPARGGS